MPHRPSWFRDGQILASNAPTCGINKDGLEQYVVDADSGLRDESTIDDQLSDDVKLVAEGNYTGGHLFWHDLDKATQSQVLVPAYYDMSSVTALQNLVETLGAGFEGLELGELAARKWIALRGGHGSPSQDQRVGDIPYVKVSDLRAGHVNVNPTNLVPLALAKSFWGGSDSGLEAYDLISPSRASKNIGQFCVLMPGQEQLILTKEVIIVRALEAAPFDQFYMLWALSLAVVQRQWNRVVLMQTNREDAGQRAQEVKIPVPASDDPEAIERASSLAEPIRTYFGTLTTARESLGAALKKGPFELHHHL